jgi:hypothetical protein
MADTAPAGVQVDVRFQRIGGLALRVGAYATFAFVAGIVAFFSMYSKFAPYDDEGYILLSIKQFAAGGSLYRDVYSQYGPFPYELWGGLYALTGRTVTPDTGRALTIVVWLATALLIGLIVERLTRRLTLGLAAAMVSFAAMTVFINEPMYLGGLAELLLVGILAAAVLIDPLRHQRLRMGLIGALLAALVLTKINIGGTALAAVCLALSVSVPALRRRSWLTPALVVACAALPFLLTAPDLASGWAQNLAVLISVSVAALGVTLMSLRRSGVPGEPDNPLSPLALAFVAGIAAIVLGALVTGSTLSDLVNGVLIKPLGQRDAFSIPASISTLAVDAGFMGLLAAVAMRKIRGNRPAESPSLLGGAVRIVAALVIWLLASGTFPITITPDPGPLALALPLAWLAALPPRGSSAMAGPGAFTRALLPALAVVGSLVIYPVAGSQVGFAAALFVPAGGLILADGGRAVADWYQARRPQHVPALAIGGSLAAVALAAALTFQLLLQPAVLDGNAYAGLKGLRFAGSIHVRQPAATTDGFARIVADLRARCDTFVTLPGMNSFYLWSRIPPPTGLNATTWMYLFDAQQQQRIVDAIKPVRRLCLVRYDAGILGWEYGARGPLPQRPLLQFLSQGFSVVDSVNGYQVMVRTQ